MGRKSKAKKIIREALNKEQKKKTQKEPSKEQAKDKSKEKKQKKKIPLLKIFATISFLILSVVTVYFMLITLRPLEIAQYFPEKETILTFEFNSDLDNLQNMEAIKALSKNPLFIKANLESFISRSFATDYLKNIKPWLGRNAGFAMIRDDKQQAKIIYFIETKSINKALESFGITDINKQILSLPKYYFPKNPIFPKPLFLTVKDKYIFLSAESQTLSFLLKADAEKRLSNSASYTAAKRNLPSQKIAFSFINNKSLNSGDLAFIETVLNQQLPKEFILSLFGIYTSEGLSLSAKNDKFVVKSFTNLKTKYTAKNSQKNYEGRLVKYLPGSVVAFFASENLGGEFEELMAFSSLDIYDTIDLSLSKYLLTKFSFKNDILSVLSDEICFFLEKDGTLGLIFEQKDPDLQKVFGDFIFSLSQYRAGFEKELVSHELEDGTIYKEYIKVPKQMQLASEIYKGIAINFYTLDGKNSSLFYAISNDLIFVSEKMENMQNILDKQIDNIPTNAINGEISEDLIFLNLENTINSPLNPFKALSITKIFTDGGILTNTTLSIK